MSDPMTFQEEMLHKAWEKRKGHWKHGTELIEQGDKHWKEVMQLPGSTRVGVWLGISEAAREAAREVFGGYTARLEGDQIWHDAVLEVKGKDARVSWEHVPEKKAYRCILSTGEVFEP
jgi:hypothetical protein